MSIPAYMRIRQYAIDLVAKSLNKEKKILSERELCELFGVTRPTVRKALKDLVDDDYLIIRPGLGTYTNPVKAVNGIFSNNTFSIGIIVGDGKHILYDCYFGDVIVGALNYVNKHAGFFRLLNISAKGSKAVDEIMLMNLSGLIWIKPPIGMCDVCEKLESRGVSVITIGRSFNNIVDNVSIDYFHEGYAVAQYFLSKGLSNIVCGAFDSKLEADELRCGGFEKAFEDAGKKFNDKLVLKAENDIVSDIHKMVEFGVEFSGIYANGIHMLRVIESLQKEKLTPGKDVLVVGSEHALRGGTKTGFVKIIEPMEKIGWLAAEKLAEKVSGKNTDRIKLKLKACIIE